MQEVKKSGWQKFKDGFSKVWNVIGAPIKAIAGAIPGIGPLISGGIGALEKIVPKGIEAGENIAAAK